jgi:hypothetical protein
MHRFHSLTFMYFRIFDNFPTLLGRAYFGSSIDLVSFVKSLVNYADQIGKNGVSVLADMGSFFHYDKLNHLIEYETSLPRRSDIKAKGFCL